MFLIAAGIYAVCASFYVIFGQGKRQDWDDPSHDVKNKNDLNETKKMLDKKEKSAL